MQPELEQVYLDVLLLTLSWAGMIRNNVRRVFCPLQGQQTYFWVKTVAPISFVCVLGAVGGAGRKSR
jgi:hypothetical protein